ncbi:ATP-grasp domain-containing protein [Kitasatospora cinereorecta]|uniref:ATP-grasp domain-containing protein n=1 Tax=Kitasatospora cinereorecta TaxID=285560 RepID=A0ABW0VN27_9ACTN
MPQPAIIVPADPLAPRRPDPHFALEARTVRELGGDVVLLDHDALLGGDAKEAVRRVPRGRGPLWYRGWMVPSDAYADLGEALAARDCTLLTTPAGYRSAHELPGWYGVFEGATPNSVWLPCTSPGAPPDAAALAGAAELLGGRGPAVVKDYVKSRKHEWAEACFVPDLADPAGLGRVVARFVELQGDDLAGGVVLRRYEEFVRDDGGRAEEARVWWLDGEAVLVGPHPDTPHLAAVPDLTAVRPLVRALGCRFVTTDLARRAGGNGTSTGTRTSGGNDDDGAQWRVVEVGDGQVSELPRGADLAALLSALLAA